MRKYLTLFPLYITMTLAAPLLFSACQSGNSQPVIALVGGSLIDGNGGEPLPQAVVLVQDGKILATGSQSTIKIPAGAQVIDLNGTTILPGFFNAHVHTAYDPEKLRTWAQAGVTTVRDLGMHADVFGNSQAFQDNLALRNETLMDPQYARIVSAGPLMSPPDGYSGNGTVTDAQDAAQKTNFQLDAGLDLIKIGIEDNLPPGRTFPLISTETASAIVQAAHARHARVSAHVSTEKHVELALAAGVDDLAHMAYTPLSDEVIQAVVEAGVYWVPTLELWSGVGWGGPTRANTHLFVAGGGQVALGTDYAGYTIPFDLGMPITEIEQLVESGMQPMQIIVSATRNAAYVCELDDRLGTLEAGKIADILVVQGDPLANLYNLLKVRLVMKQGVIIRETN